MNKNYSRVRLACHTVNIIMAIVANLSPLLFLTFRSIYGISYSLLGTLVLIFFCTQLGIDLIFSFFSHKFNIQATVRILPFLTVTGLAIYALVPTFLPSHAYLGLAIGTTLFAVSSGLAEVLMSPIVAAIPSDDPEGEMSKLHAAYAWGVVFTVIFSTVFLLLFGRENWYLIALIFCIFPIFAAILFATSTIPPMQTPERASGALKMLKNKGIWLCVAAIFLGGAAECTMAQWASGYLEQALGIEKIWGDIFGVALFAVMLGLGRTIYAKIGKNIAKVLFVGAIGATACYLVAAISNIAVIGLIACAFTGFCASMMWPGSLLIASDKYPTAGVFIYALMAAGGDLGASVGPQLVGSITDLALESQALISLSQTLALTPEQLGMKLGMLVGMLFPLVAIIVFGTFARQKKK